MKKIRKLLKNRLTSFDIVFGLIFLVVILGIFLFFKRKTEYVNIRVKVTDQDILYAHTNPKNWYANRFNVGDKELNGLGQTISQITNVESFDISENTSTVYLDINIKSVYNKHTKLYTAKGTNLTFGNTIRFNFLDVSFMGLITESPDTLNQKDYQEETREIVVIERGAGPLLYGGPGSIEPEVLEKIKVGDTINDSNGKILAKVKNISLRPAQRITQTNGGDLLMRYDPYYKDALITIDILVKNYKGDEFVFDTYPFKIGSEIPLNFTYASILPRIIEIK